MPTEKLFFNQLVTKNLTVSKDSGERFFSGILTVQVKDKQGEILIVDEIMKVLPIWMKRGAPISDTHSNRIVGKGINYQRVKVKDSNGSIYPGVEITGVIYKDYKLDDDIWEKMKSGYYRGLSFGGATKSDREPTTWVDGSLAYNLKDLEQYEVAVCREPAVPLALFTDIHTIAKSSKPIQYKKKSEDLICIQCNNVGCYIEKRIYGDPKTISSDSINKGGMDNPMNGVGGQVINEDTLPDKESQKSESVTPDPTEDDMTSGSMHISPTGKGDLGVTETNYGIYPETEPRNPKEKGLVEDQHHDKCIHCGYIVTDGNQTLKEHMSMDHPDKLPWGTEVEKPQENESGAPKDDPPDPREHDLDARQAPGDDQNPGTFPASNSNDPMYAKYPQGMTDLMVETPTADKVIPNDTPEFTHQDNAERNPAYNIPSHDQKDTETGVSTGMGGGGNVNDRISNERLPNQYDKYGVGRDTYRNEDQNLNGMNTAGSGNSIDQEDSASQERQKRPESDEEKEVNERPKDSIKSAVVYTPEEAGYVQSLTPRKCSSCEYFKYPNVCTLPLDISVDPELGCCNHWEPKEKLFGDIIYLGKADGDKAKIKLEGKPAEQLLEQAGILQPTQKGPKVVSGHKQYANPQPEIAGVNEITASSNTSSDTVFDPNPEESPYKIDSFDVGMRTFKSGEEECGICGRGRDKHDRDSGHPFKGLVEKSQVIDYAYWIMAKLGVKKEEVPIDDVINWVKVMNPSQLQHAIDPNNWYDWSAPLSRLTWDEMNEDQRRLLVATYAFRNDGKTVEGLDNQSMIPKEEGEPQSQAGNIGKYFPEDPTDIRNINATPEPMQVGQERARTYFGGDQEKRLESTEKNLKILELDSKLRRLRNR